MKLLVTISLLFILNLLSAQIEAIFDLKRFKSVDENYIETYLYIYGNSLKQNKDTADNDKGVEILQYIEDIDNKIIAHKKYIIKDKSDYVEAKGIMDLQRFVVKGGEFKILLELTDLNNPSNISKHEQNFKINFNEKVNFSDIELLDSYWKTNNKDEAKNELTKSGFHMVPLVTNYFGPEFEKLAYYFEIYGMNNFTNTDHLLLKQSIFVSGTDKIAGQYNKIKKIPTNNIQPILNTFNLSNLPTGNYDLKLELIITRLKNISFKERKNGILNLRKIILQMKVLI